MTIASNDRANRTGRFVLTTMLAALTAIGAACSPDQRTAQQSAETNAQALLGPDAARHTAALAYHDNWRKLWEDHITWTRMVIIGIFDDLPGTPQYTARLLQNYEDMEAALSPYYAEDDVDEFGDLLEDHLTIAASILVAAKAGDTNQVNTLVTQWRANADALAAKMNEMNPTFWPLESTRAMWQEHLNVTLDEAVKHLTGDYTGEIAAWEQVHTGGLMMADLFSNGVVQQFPNRFTRSGTLR